MRFAIAAAALALGAQGELLHDRFHRMAANQGHSNGTAPSRTTAAVPGPSNSTVPVPPRNSTGCLDLTNLKPEDWEAVETSEWLDNWWKTNEQAISQNGFLSTFGAQVLNDPTWTCAIDGICEVGCVPMGKASAVLGSLQARQAPVDVSLNNNGGASSNNGGPQPGGNVAASLTNLQSQFHSLRGILTDAGTQTSLDIDSLVQNFWYSPSDGSMEMSQGLRALAMIVGIAASFVTGGAAIPAAAGSAIVGGSIALGLGSMAPPGEPRWVKAGEVGHEISNFLSASQKGLDMMYNQIANGESIGDSNVDLRTLLSNGTYLSSHYGEMSAMMAAAMKSVVINTLWKEMNVFIIGGAACVEDQGIGSTGPKDGYEMIWWCDDENKAWYLYHYEAGDSHTDHFNERVDRPWGADRMGENSYLSTHGGSPPYWPDLNPWNVVISSVKSYKVAGLNYTAEKWQSRIDDMFRAGSNPWFEGNAMEGLWTIPVCDISQTVTSDFYKKEEILKPYGYASQPHWCGPICDNNWESTKAFYKAAKIEITDDVEHTYPFGSDCGK